MRKDLTDILSRNRPQLVENIDIEHGLLNDLLAMNVLTKRQIKSIEVLPDPFKQVESLLDMLRRRPDEDFDKFCDALIRRNQDDVVKSYLRPVTETHSASETHKKDIDSEVSHFEQESEPTSLNITSVQKTTSQFYNEFKNKAYSMCNKRRGKCYIFNIKNVKGMSKREGSEEDMNNLKELFHELHFSTQSYTDLNASEILHEVNMICQDPGLRNDQALVLFFLSHGHIMMSKTQQGNSEVEFIYGSDGEPVNTENLLEPLTNIRCPTMNGKPKLVFFQACRRTYSSSTYSETKTDALPGKRDEGNSASSSSGESTSQEETAAAAAATLPISLKDFVIGYSSESGHPSYRNTNSGSWYINGIVEVFTECAHNMDVCAMLRKVNGLVTERKPAGQLVNEGSIACNGQVATHIDSLTKPYLFFFPGITTEESSTN